MEGPHAGSGSLLTQPSAHSPLPRRPALTPKENTKLLPPRPVTRAPLPLASLLSCVRRCRALPGLTLGAGPWSAWWLADPCLQGAPILRLVPPSGMSHGHPMGDTQPGPNALEVSLSPASRRTRPEWPAERAFLGKPGRLLRPQAPGGSRLSQDCGQCWPWPGPPTPSCGGLSAREAAP